MDEIENEKGLDLDVLDNLIKKYCKHFENKIDEKAKIGDLLKMIELKRKLSPENSEQKKFWKMLNKIRKENLQNKNETTHTKKSQDKK